MSDSEPWLPYFVTVAVMVINLDTTELVTGRSRLRRFRANRRQRAAVTENRECLNARISAKADTETISKKSLEPASAPGSGPADEGLNAFDHRTPREALSGSPEVSFTFVAAGQRAGPP